MAILALEPDPTRASTIRHIVCDVVRADLRLVRSKAELLQALGAEIPDLILLPALLSPADEAELLSHLSTLQNSGHLEILVTPFTFAPENPQAPAARGWRRWLDKGKPQLQVPACDRRAFAEQLMWSLRRARELRQELPPERPMVAQTDVAVPALLGTSPSDRRVHRRFQADELQGLRIARIKHGPLVRLVDCSSGGALVESEVPLQPDSEAVLELVAGVRHSIVPFRVLRCHASVVESRLLYWGACAFTQPLELGDLLQPRSNDMPASAPSQPDRFDIAVRTIAEQYGHPLQASQLTEVVRSLQEVSDSRPFDSAGYAMKNLLEVGIAALQHGDKSDVTFTRIEEKLQMALPSLTARFAAIPTSITADDSEALYLQVPAASGIAPRVLNVELPRGAVLEDWQFRLLKASTYLAALVQPLSAATPTRPSEGRERRRHVRVQGRFEGRRLGAISLPVVIHDISEAGCFVDSFHDEESGRQLSLEVNLPDAGWVTVQAEVVCSRPGFGFAVQFIEMSKEVRACFARVVAERMEPAEPQFAQSLIA